MSKEKTTTTKNVNIKNKRASFEYEFIDEYTAGIVLTGTEIKSIRAGKAGLVDSYCYFINQELWVKNMYVAHYLQGSFANHIEKRERKLLLNRKELRSLENECKNPGFTIVPTELYIDENGRAKLNIALARGKKQYDKRQSLKAKEDRREIDRAYKSKV
ncbi:MAG: SsrA-binding protein SmpB [Prevotellaceae bacterium]|nr:SsrA-binding protein SmpB [Candidatus Colivivens equi]MCQ2077218.1 SsrA-binding protein SmpB [Bacteroidaceae bacterium]